MGLDRMRRAVTTLMPGRDVALPPASFAGKKHDSSQRRFENPHRVNYPEDALAPAVFIRQHIQSF
jgi:hypothetical protein